MKRKGRDDADYERLLAQERLILEATETIVGLLEEQGVSRQELANRLGKTKGFISQILSGERNMTLRTLADLGQALGRRFSLIPIPATGGAPDLGALTALFAAYSVPDPRLRLSPATVNERLRRVADEFSVDRGRFHELPLAA